jgi:phosphinothricin acetyltransferase
VTAGIIRAALESDAAAILEIYAPYILNTAVTFETELPSLEEIRARIREYGKRGWFVCERDGRVIGYAYASKHRERTAYQWCCEVSAYISDEWHGQGIGTALYQKLFDCLRAKGFVNLYAGISLPNPASVKLHESLGFKPIGVYEKIGYKLGSWHDVGWWDLKLFDCSQNHEPPAPRI